MGRWASGIILRVFTAVLSVIAFVWLALWYLIPAPPSTIAILAGIKGGAFDHFAEEYKSILAARHVELNLRLIQSGDELLKLVEDPRSGLDAAFLFGGTSNGAHLPNFVSLGRINYAPVWIFYRGPAKLDRLTQLKGKRVNVAPGFRPAIIKILEAHGVNSDNTPISTMAAPEGIRALKSGALDVDFLPPQDPDTPLVQSLIRDPNVQLMNLSQADSLTQLFPGLNRLVLRQGVIDLEKNIPATDVNLIATTNVVVVPKDLHPETIYLLAQTLQEVHSRAGLFQRAGEFPIPNDPEFPIAEEARDFYKNGPSFWQKYLPFWMISYAKRIAAILVTTIAIVIPIFSFTPRLYAWFLQKYSEKLYRRVRFVEASLQTDLTDRDVEVLQRELENVSRAAHILPMQHSSLFFDLIMHIDLTRTRLASRLVRPRSQAA
jgi:hypothetical protein